MSESNRALLTVLTGMSAGQLLAIDRAPIIIGRAADADLVVEGEGISDHHARIDRTAAGAYYLHDLDSTAGSFLGTLRVGIALLRAGDTLRLGPNLQLRFTLIHVDELL